MKRKGYIAPMSEVIRCENFCEEIPVHFSGEGSGDVGAKEMNFSDDFFDKNFLPSEFNDVWEE